MSVGDDIVTGLVAAGVTITGQRGIAGPGGSQGPQGSQGDIGPQGEQGPQGSPGQDGAPGPAGPTGPQGSKGAPGSDGAAGAAGMDGRDGEPGPRPVRAVVEDRDSTGHITLIRQYMNDGSTFLKSARYDPAGRFTELVEVA